MARVNVRDTACHDSRLKVAGKAMSLNYERLGWRLIPVWSRITETNSPIVSLNLLSADLGKSTDIVAAGLIAGELADTFDDEHLDLSPMMGALFDDYRWLARKRKEESPGQAETCSLGTQERTLALLASGPLRRSELRKQLAIQRRRALDAVRELLTDGLIVELDDGTVALACAQPGTDNQVPSTDNSVLGTDQPVPATESVPTDEYPEPVPNASLARARAPARTPVPARASGAHAHAREGTAGLEPPASDPLENDELVPPAKRRDIARLLWACQERRRARLDPHAPRLPVDDVPGGSLDAVVLALAKYTPKDCCHALDMFAIEGACMAGEGGDALQYLNGRTNWKREQLDRAAGTTAEAIKKRFRTQAHRNRSQPQEQTPPMRSLDHHEP